MELLRAVLYLSSLAVLASALAHNTRLGSLEGVQLKSLGGIEYYAFLGVPYAKAPVGQLRLAAPVKYGEWEGVLNATEKGKACIQPKTVFHHEPVSEIVGDEDCLTVNIYTRSPSREDKVPVLVYIHGGGFRNGAHIAPSQTKRIMDKDLVYVTVQYRLGPLGFFSTEDHTIPGNFGLKDQQLALKWVKKNIMDYGGNPDSITVHGESAGGASVHFHMKNPKSQKLFHRAISESGTSTTLWAVAPPGLMLDRTQEAGESIGCTPTPHKELLECLRKKSIKQIVDSEKIFGIWDSDPVCVFRPVIENKDNSDAFLTQDPFEMESSLPWITGVTSDEGAIKSQSMYHLPKSEIERFNQNRDRILPFGLLYGETSTDPDQITKLVKQRYFKNDDNVIHELQDAVTDAFFIWTLRPSLDKHNGPVWQYLFDYRGNVSWTDVFTYPKSTPNFGVCHADELMYLFWMKEVYPPMKVNDDDENMAKIIIDIFSNFVFHGHPSPNSTPKWDQTTTKNEYLHITKSELKMENGLYEDAVQFWLNLPNLRNKFNQSETKSEQ